MAPDYSISGIGNYGLSPSGAYGSYDAYMPSMIGMNSFGMGMYNPSLFGAYGGMGMMGMYNPTFMAQMQNQIEQMQLDHSAVMHTKMANNKVQATQNTDLEIIRKLLVNGSVQQGVLNLYNKVREGDQNGICQEFDKLRNQIFNTYKDELGARGTKENPATAATQIVEALYANIVSAQTGQTADLRSDIKRYGDGAMMNGFMKGFRSGHHDKFVDETMNHCFGQRIDQLGAKELRQDIGQGVGRTASVLEKGVYGTVAGGILAVVGKGAWRGLKKTFGKNVTFSKPFFTKGLGRFAIVAGLAAAAADIIWQVSDSKASA